MTEMSLVSVVACPLLLLMIDNPYNQRVGLLVFTIFHHVFLSGPTTARFWVTFFGSAAIALVPVSACGRVATWYTTFYHFVDSWFSFLWACPRLRFVRYGLVFFYAFALVYGTHVTAQILLPCWCLPHVVYVDRMFYFAMFFVAWKGGSFVVYEQAWIYATLVALKEAPSSNGVIAEDLCHPEINAWTPFSRVSAATAPAAAASVAAVSSPSHPFGIALISPSAAAATAAAGIAAVLSPIHPSRGG